MGRVPKVSLMFTTELGITGAFNNAIQDSNIPAIEVYFSTEFIYKEVGSDVNLFGTIDYGVNTILLLLTDLGKEISIEASKSRKIIQDKISKLKFLRKVTEVKL